MPLKVAIIGRPNVGKSTLFNRLVGKRRALVHDIPGMTRDWREGETRIARHPITVYDTAGLDEAGEGSLEDRMRGMTAQAVGAADLILFLIDARSDLTPLDEHLAGWLRETGKQVQVIANKCEGAAGEGGYYEAYSLGFGEPIAVSAEHGDGLGELYAFLSDAADDAAEEEGSAALSAPAGAPPLRLAVVGRPNAGKSTLVNTLLGRERVLTGPEAGITRDTVVIDWAWQDRPVRLFDTAGLRRRGRVSGPLEKLAVSDALEAIRFAEAVVLLLDAAHPWEKQDRHLAGLIAEEGRAMVIALNKWDLVTDGAAVRRELEAAVDAALPEVRGVPIVPVSALTGVGIAGLMAAVFEVEERWNRREQTAPLNRILAAAVAAHPPPAPGGKRIKLRYMTQVKSRPPTFIVFASRPEALPESYIRYLINVLRDELDLPGVPIRVTLRKGENPYVSDRQSR